MRELKGDFRDLFGCFMIALDLRKMFLCLVGTVLTILAVGAVTYVAAEWFTPDDQEVWCMEFEEHGGTLERVLTPAAHLDRDYEVGRLTLCSLFTDHFRGWVRVLKWNLENGRNLSGLCLYGLVIALMWTLIWSIFGGASSRIAAVEIAKDERIETRRSLDYSKKKYSSFFWSFWACVLGFAFFFLIITLFGLFGRLGFVMADSVGYIFSGLLMLLLPLALLSGFILILIAIGTAFGYPLFYPAISAEGTDAFDAISRGFSYIYSKPWHYIFYQLCALIYGLICTAFILLFAWLMVKVSLFAGHWGIGSGFDEVLRGSLVEGGRELGYVLTQGMIEEGIDEPQFSVLALLCTVFLNIWIFVVFGLAFSYAGSYYVSAQSMIYFLLRKKTDGIEMAEVFEDRQEEEPAFAEPPKPAEPAAMPAEEAKPADEGGAGTSETPGGEALPEKPADSGSDAAKES